MSKAIESAVKRFQIYAGSTGLPVKTQQRFYAAMMKAAQQLAAKKGMPVDAVIEQLSREALRRGAIIPLPGKDF